MPQNYGASPGDWAHFDLILGLGADLLPVVSNPSAVISPASKMGAVGKTPSEYNARHEVRGLIGWTDTRASAAQLDKWAAQPDYGICVQTRLARAIDVDVTDAQEANSIRSELVKYSLPERFRANSSKFLQVFELPGDLAKRVIKTRHGVIELLGTGQQFIAIGTHPSGARYDWVNGLPYELPKLDLKEFELLWSNLQAKFGVEPAKSTKTTLSKQAKLHEANQNDITALALIELGSVLSAERDGRMHITCPFADEHTGEGAESATTYFPANTGGFERGHFKCLHAHCADRSDSDFRQALGIETDDFEDLTNVVSPEAKEKPAVGKFAIQATADFLASGSETEWLIKGVLPKTELAFIYGEPGSGKTFFALDMAAHVARGLAWNSKKTTQGKVLYIAAERVDGVRKRVRAYQQYHEGDYASLSFLAASPRLNHEQDRKDLWTAIRSHGQIDLIVLDTLAAVTPGVEENSSKDYGPILHYCKELHARTGALVLFVHHTGKDASKGMRGSSALLGASGCQILVERFGEGRVATIAKLSDGEDKAEYGFRLQTVDLGLDADGEPITSCVALPAEVQQQSPKADKDSLLRLIHNTFEDLAVAGPVVVGALIDAVLEKLPVTEGRDTRKGRVQKAYEKMLANGELASVNGFVESG